MKNIEYNFCLNTVSIRTESLSAGREKYLARGPFVLKGERRYSRSARPQYYEIFRYSMIPPLLNRIAEQDSGEKLLRTAHAKYGWDSTLMFPESLRNAKSLTSISFKI